MHTKLETCWIRKNKLALKTFGGSIGDGDCTSVELHEDLLKVLL
jgi:hypothetical protein